MNRKQYAIMFRYKIYDDDVSEVSLPSEYATRPMHVQNGYVNNSNTEQSQPLMSGAVENGKRCLLVFRHNCIIHTARYSTIHEQALYH